MSRQDSRKVSDVKVMLVKGADGSSIASIEKTGSVLNVDTYAVTLTDGSKTSFQVVNGVSIESIERTGVSANVDTYTIYLSNGTTSTFTVTNGRDTHAQMAERVTSPATLSYSIGDYVTFNDLFCEVTAPIAVGDTFAIGTNLKATTVGDEMEIIKSSTNSRISDVEDDISDLGTSLSGDISQLSTTLGNQITQLSNNKQDKFTTGTGIQNVNNVLSIKQSDLLNLFYPVGTIYESTNSSFNPNTAWGGSWSKIEGRFLLGSSSSYSIGSTGGEATHRLTTSEIPSHSHTYTDTIFETDTGSIQLEGPDITLDNTENDFVGVSKSTGSAGGGSAHNNMPPYQVVNIWKRTA